MSPVTHPRSVSIRWSLGSRLLSAVVTAIALLVWTVSLASAHNTLRSSTPEDGETVPRTPEVVVLVFDESALAMGAQIVVTGPSGPVQTGAPTVSGQSVRQALAADSPAGNYSITWRVTSEDGHPVTGTLHFTAQAAGGGQAPQESAPPAATNNSGGASVQTKLVLIAALVAAAGIGALLWRSLRRKQGAAP